MSLPFPEYDDLDATGLAEVIRKGEVGPGEALDAALARVDARNPALNAVVHDLRDRAKARVDRLPDGPLTGVPFLLKDLKAALAGTPTTGSCKLWHDHVPMQSSVNVERYEAAGLQIIGKTNTPELGIMGITEPAFRGPCRNPWDTGRTPGGSSGGASSAVAARMVPVAHGGDGGGSIRIPASATGLFGLKPTRGRVTMAPFMGDAWGGYVQEHVLARTVRDSALLLDIVCGGAPGEPYVAPAPERPYVEEVGRDPGKLRIAFTREALFGTEQHADCKAAVDDAVALLRSLGHEVVEGCPPFHREELVRAYFLQVASGVAYYCEEAAKYAGRKPSGADFEPATWLLALIGWKSSAADLERSRQTVQKAARAVGQWFEDVDVFVTSTLARPPARIGELLPTPGELNQMRALRALPLKPLLDVALDKMGSGKLAATPNTQLFNQTGQPGVSVPLYWNSEGLPIGTQLVGRFGDEATLIRLGAQLEQARPWADRKPELAG
jgi:amidase